MSNLLEERKIVEYEDAPSGSIFFYNYKEPLIPFEGGHGYEGALVYDATSEKIQCHFCGEWFDSVARHLAREHNMTAAEYKEKVGLNKTTALINEKIRSKLVVKGLERRMKNLRPGKKHTEDTKRRISMAGKQNRMELRNMRGTCPAQLIDRLVALYNKLGRTPTQDEITFINTLERTYGSMENACRVAGIPYRKVGETVASRYMKARSVEKTKNFIREFYDENKRLPKKSESPSGVFRILRLHNKRQIIKEALTQDGLFKPVSYRIRYTDEELLDFLRIFERVNGRRPSYSDAKRKLIPPLSTYNYHFGSWQKALRAAFTVESPMTLRKQLAVTS